MGITIDITGGKKITFNEIKIKKMNCNFSTPPNSLARSTERHHTITIVGRLAKNAAEYEIESNLDEWSQMAFADQNDFYRHIHIQQIYTDVVNRNINFESVAVKKFERHHDTDLFTLVLSQKQDKLDKVSFEQEKPKDSEQDDSSYFKLESENIKEKKNEDTPRDKQVLTKASGKVLKVGTNELSELRKKWSVPKTDTIATGRTDVKGLEDFIFEGGSPKVRKEAGLPDLDEAFPDRVIKAPANTIPLGTRHAEEGVINQFIDAVEEANLSPENVNGTLKVHQSNPKGVCPTCLSGLGNPNASSGVVKQLSEKYPNLTIEISSEIVDGIKANGKLNLKVKNGVYID